MMMAECTHTWIKQVKTLSCLLNFSQSIKGKNPVAGFPMEGEVTGTAGTDGTGIGAGNGTTISRGSLGTVFFRISATSSRMTLAELAIDVKRFRKLK
jgi:hypothetical protein